MTFTIDIARSAPRTSDTVAYAIGTEGPVPRQVGMSRGVLAGHGFEGKPGQVLSLPNPTGGLTVVVGVGAAKDRTANSLRTAAAAVARAVWKRSSLVTNLADVDGVDSKAAAQAVVEGLALGSYRYVGLKNDASGVSKLSAVTLLVNQGKATAATAGADRGMKIADAVATARDLANRPPSHLTAAMMADRAQELAASAGLGIEIYDNEAAAEMGLGGIVGVNRGSTEPLRMVKLTYEPRNPKGHVALIGKGVMYDSGGISLKPSDGMHVNMKMDMTGAAVVLGVMSVLKALRVKTQVTAYLCCTDNMPDGNALKLGDVLTMRNAKTVEIHNTDAEGRLVMADGLSLAAESKPDAMIDIATLTGAAMGALGLKIAAVLGNNQPWVEQLQQSSARTDELIWQMPLHREYRKLLDSGVADMRNIGGPYGGVITAALFLDEFTAGIPWAHLDIAGVMNSDGDEGWISKGASAFGLRLILDAVEQFTKP